MLGSPAHAAAAQTGAAAALAPLDLAEWSYFFVGVERAELARGSFVNGKQMYVESFIPAQVRHPYPMVLVHGGGGQGLDWMGTPDGRRGWAQILLEEGYKVYVVDRPGHGRSPFHPDVDGPFPAQNLALEAMSGQVHAAERRGARQRAVSQAAQPVAGDRRARLARSRSVRRVAGRLRVQAVAAPRPVRPRPVARALAAGPADAGRGAGAAAADGVAARRPRFSDRPARRRADRIRSTWCGVSAARCCSTRSAPRSS